MLVTLAVPSALILLAAVSATPLWLRSEKRFDSRLSTNPRELADYELPKTIVPSRYDVHLIPYLNINFPSPEKKFTFDGLVTIRIICKEDTSVIKMHAFDINIDSRDKIIVTRRVMPSENVPVKSFATSDASDDKNFLTIELDQPLKAFDTYDLEIAYTGSLNDDMEGFYRSSYVEAGVEK